MGFEMGEYYGLLLFGAAGMVLLVAANELVTLFIAFEVMSLSIYTLVAITRGDARSIEGAIKYFVLGAFSSGFLLYGLALLYGATGTIYLSDMAALHGTAAQTPALALTAIALLIVGFSFKVGAAPFHAWIPDAYQGAPASVTGFMAVAVKAAAFGVFIRVLGATGVLASVTWTPGMDLPGLPGTRALWLLAAMTMILGNVAALTQNNVKRLLGYSGIAHSGYVLVGLAAATRVPEATAAALYYLAGYAATTIGAFAVLTALRRAGRDVEEVDDLGGLARERPALALAMAIFMASLLGIPPTAGFMGKLWIFREAIAADMKGLVILALATTAISIYYYLRVIAVMFTAEPAGDRAEATSFPTAFAVAATATLVLLIGVSDGTFEAAKSAVRAIVGG
jgi:NADH-quinone oxidoreductase subunit N